MGPGRIGRVEGETGGETWQLFRLAAAQPDVWVPLPASSPHLFPAALLLTHRCPLQVAAAGGEWLLCLGGRAVLDLPGGQWAELSAGDAHHLPAGTAWAALPAEKEAVLLRLRGP